MKKSIDKAGLRAKLHDDMSIMVGGFLANRTPERITDILIEYEVKDPTMIINDTSYPGRSCDRLIANKQVRHLIVLHVGTNPITAEQMNNGKLKVEFSPQSTLAERIRVGDCGLGGVLTTTGLGTVIAEGKKVININGQDYLLRLSLRADIAFIKGTVDNGAGNLIYKGTTQGFQPLMAMAADCVVTEIDELVPVEQISPEAVHTSDILIDCIFG